MIYCKRCCLYAVLTTWMTVGRTWGADMIRLATEKDAEQLLLLNEAFNGKGLTTPDDIKQSLSQNPREVVVVAEEGETVAGFVCVQIKRSFCYQDDFAEITEVFVAPEYRRRKLAGKMLAYAEEYCMRQYQIHEFALLTGRDNHAAQALYRSRGYREEDEMFMTKIVPLFLSKKSVIYRQN